MILWPDEARDPAVAGGKAAALARLSEVGFAVPPFCVLPAEAMDELCTGTLSEAALGHALAEAATRLGPGSFAVRSSARAEDSEADSHAGQFDSVLNVPAAGLPEAARKVHASGAGERLSAYRKRRALAGGGAPAVLIQRMVAPRAAGVAFSVDPVTGRRNRALVSAVAGLADRLVSGMADGEGWTFGADGQVVEAPVAPTVLTADEAREVAALARAAEAHFGAPQDIEWALDDNRLWLVQSRPVTTALRPVPVPDDTLMVFDNSNIVESYPGLVSPLTYSFARYCYDRVYRAFVDLLGVPDAQVRANRQVFANMLSRLDGRVYYNLGNWYRALALLPGFSLNRGFMDTMMGVDEPLPEEMTARLAPPPAGALARLGDMMRLGRVAVGLVWSALTLGRTKRRFMARLEGALAAEEGLAEANLTELGALYRRLEGDLLDRWDAPLVNDFLCMIGYGGSRALMGRWAGEAGLRLHADLLIGQGGIVSAEPVTRIAAMGARARATGLVDRIEAEGMAAADPELSQMIAAYIDRFGDRCTEELKLESPTLVDDPAPLMRAIAAAGRRHAAPRPERPAPDWQGLFPNPVRRAIARRFARWAQARVRDRENLRFERTRIFGTARRIFLAMGREFAALGHLEEARDIFFLTVEEVLGAIEGSALSYDLAGPVRQRKAEMAAAATRPDPPERVLLRGAAVGLAEGRPALAAAPAPAGETMRRGTGASAGTLRAVARVVTDPREGALGPGEILVARNTDPGWIALFANAGGIVVERGSLLSHSAIVARELGLPCVVGLKGATRWVTDGETIEIDGASGEVRKSDG
ncbi:phosphohistidine swiveling domain-containing protein [Rhodovulum iodosum]|uniref:Phosphohistidine swiveling domain-containing protein n=1 Tax=Rhodovulum iodosum TaxID=68291 RepID=A0ABV3XPC9_9RHOB|nr:PEP/pyruvate-binding domain-containing protein [Rhodovulum robiginosum]RSK31527.1 phosphoenolpyruvate synthase [Rhodovulum robiginosum]